MPPHSQASRRPSYSSRRYQGRISCWHCLDFSDPLGSTQGSVPGNADSFPRLVPNLGPCSADSWLQGRPVSCQSSASESSSSPLLLVTGAALSILGRMRGWRTENISLQVLLSSERPHRLVESSRVGLLPSCHNVGWSQEGSREAERGLQGNRVCVQVKLVKLIARGKKDTERK